MSIHSVDAFDVARLCAQARGVATTDERKRLSRTLHDGVTQELVSLGYAVDELVANQCDGPAQTSLLGVRSQLSQVMRDLRSTIFDLRVDADQPIGLCCRLTQQTSEVAAQTPTAVHVQLEESSRHLRADLELELSQIAGEAIANAGRHAHAENLWVTCRVDGDRAEILIEDDGRGSALARDGHYGLQIMHERAAHIDAAVSVCERSGGGTTVSVVYDPAPLEAPSASPAPLEPHSAPLEPHSAHLGGDDAVQAASR